MPYRSKAQQRLFYALEANGELPKGTADEWSEHTDFSHLPERVKKNSKKTKQVKKATHGAQTAKIEPIRPASGPATAAHGQNGQLAIAAALSNQQASQQHTQPSQPQNPAGWKPSLHGVSDGSLLSKLVESTDVSQQPTKIALHVLTKKALVGVDIPSPTAAPATANPVTPPLAAAKPSGAPLAQGRDSAGLTPPPPAPPQAAAAPSAQNNFSAPKTTSGIPTSPQFSNGFSGAVGGPSGKPTPVRPGTAQPENNSSNFRGPTQLTRGWGRPETHGINNNAQQDVSESPHPDIDGAIDERVRQIDRKSYLSEQWQRVIAARHAALLRHRSMYGNPMPTSLAEAKVKQQTEDPQAAAESRARVNSILQRWAKNDTDPGFAERLSQRLGKSASVKAAESALIKMGYGPFNPYGGYGIYSGHGFSPYAPQPAYGNGMPGQMSILQQLEMMRQLRDRPQGQQQAQPTSNKISPVPELDFNPSTHTPIDIQGYYARSLRQLRNEMRARGMSDEEMQPYLAAVVNQREQQLLDYAEERKAIGMQPWQPNEQTPAKPSKNPQEMVEEWQRTLYDPSADETAKRQAWESYKNYQATQAFLKQQFDPSAQKSPVSASASVSPFADFGSVANDPKARQKFVSGLSQDEQDKYNNHLLAGSDATLKRMASNALNEINELSSQIKQETPGFSHGLYGKVLPEWMGYGEADKHVKVLQSALDAKIKYLYDIGYRVNSNQDGSYSLHNGQSHNFTLRPGVRLNAMSLRPEDEQVRDFSDYFSSQHKNWKPSAANLTPTWAQPATTASPAAAVANPPAGTIGLPPTPQGRGAGNNPPTPPPAPQPAGPAVAATKQMPPAEG